MKKILFATMLITAMAVGCQEAELENGAISNGEVFKISAALPETKTTFDPDGYQVTWEADDELTVIINSNDAYKFTKSADANDFEATGVSLQEGVNTYHVLYPYNSYVQEVDAEGFTSRNGEKTYVSIPDQTAETQATVDNTDHIKGVMYGYTTADISETPSIQMHQLTTLLKIAVTNSSAEAIEVQSITVSTDAPDQYLSGTFFINLETGEVESSGEVYTDNYTTLEVSNGRIEAGAIGTFWVSSNPFSVPVGSTLTIAVGTDKGSVSDERTYQENIDFQAGTVNSASFEYSEPDAIEHITVAAFLEKSVSATTYYELTGKISNISNSTYGNFDLTDETGTVYVYGLTATKVSSNDKSFSSLGLREGDVVTLHGTRDYHEKDQVGGPAYYISHVAAPYCDVAPASLSVNSEAGSTQFTVSSNESWTITSSNSAYTVSPASGEGDATIEVSYPENAEAEAVEVIFTIKSATTEKTITLIQSAAGASIEPTELFISEYVEGSSFNKYIEIYNPTSQAIDLSGYSIVMHNFNSKHSFSQDQTMELSGSIEAGATVVYAHSDATAYSGTVILGENDNVMNFNGNDPVSLYHNGVEIDRFGPANDAVSGDFAKDHTYRRVSSVIAPSNVWVETEWEELGKDDVSDLGKHTMNK